MERRNFLLALTALPFITGAHTKPLDPPLHIWMSDGEDVYIASSPEDAAKLFREATGCTSACPHKAPVGCCLGAAVEDWQMWPDKTPFTFMQEEGDLDDPHGLIPMKVIHLGSGMVAVTRPPHDWCVIFGRGYMGSDGA